jgi:hypothetical protein
MSNDSAQERRFSRSTTSGAAVYRDYRDNFCNLARQGGRTR